MKLKDSEFNKLLKIDGADLILWKHIKGELTLSNKQLDKIIKERKIISNEDN